jgi:hypothetical protein
MQISQILQFQSLCAFSHIYYKPEFLVTNPNARSLDKYLALNPPPPIFHVSASGLTDICLTVRTLSESTLAAGWTTYI